MGSTRQAASQVSGDAEFSGKSANPMKLKVRAKTVRAKALKKQARLKP